MKMQSAVGAKLHIKGAFECKDKDGRVLKVIQVDSQVPLEQLGLSVEDAKKLVADQHSAAQGSTPS